MRLQPTPNEIIGENFRIWRERCEVPRASLALMLGKTVAQICEIEEGSLELSVFDAYRAAGILDCSIFDLLDGVGRVKVTKSIEREESTRPSQGDQKGTS